ncbi:uncharacterized protein LOC106660454 [Trichogramma pretiosum]|uniref:uncharacterized protein LOC106660454 n=1 Tax=Trichogramma pretiosum TaxID=7493 RepID=UPI0006C94364|nr:uncharacterized protein LOC106660454 [Trichogramma pretiosum]
MSRIVGALICLSLAVAGLSAEELPKGVKTCKRDSADYTSCLRLAIQESWLTFVKGIPEIGLPVLDPMVVDYMENQYDFGDVNGRFALRDVKTYGMAKINFLAVRPKYDGDKMDMDIDVAIPKIYIDGYYKADGAIGNFKVGGKGYFNISMEGIRTTWSLKGRVENDRWVIEHFYMSPQVESMKVYFDDLFNGNQALNQAAMVFVNEYWPVLYNSMLPVVRDHWDLHLSDFVNRLIFSKISVSTYFP